MPASQKITVFEGLEFETEPKKHPDPVYYTDERPKFDVTITCTEDSKYEWSDDSAFTWCVEIDGRETSRGEQEFGPLDYGESNTVTVGGDLLAHEGHGVFGISTSGASGKGDSKKRKLNSGRSRTARPAYSFSVWDEPHYHATLRRPQRLQTAMIFTSLTLIAVAVLQVILLYVIYF